MSRDSTHTLAAELTVNFQLSGMPSDEHEAAYPKVAITYRYSPGTPTYIPRGEYAALDPPEPEELELIGVTLLDGDGLNPARADLHRWASEWLDLEGFAAACEHAESERAEARAAMREAAREASNDDDGFRDFPPHDEGDSA